MKIAHQEDYQHARRRAYPDIEDQLDALWKALAALAGKGTDLGPEAAAMLAAINAVKAKYPPPVNK